MIKGFHHAALSTPDLDRCVRFYTEVIGCEMGWTFGWDAGEESADAVTGLGNSSARAAMLKLHGSFIEIFEFRTPKATPQRGDRPVCDHGITHICIEVADIHAEYVRLKSCGMRFHCPPQKQDTGWVTYGRDCDGNVLELLQFG